MSRAWKITAAALLGLGLCLTPAAAMAGAGQPHHEQADGCDHGATGKPCRPDPQPTHGRDCATHGRHGGVNEDHCGPATPGPTTTRPPRPTHTPHPTRSTPCPTTTSPTPPSTTSSPPPSPSGSTSTTPTAAHTPRTWTGTRRPTPTSVRTASASSSTSSATVVPRPVSTAPVHGSRTLSPGGTATTFSRSTLAYTGTRVWWTLALGTSLLLAGGVALYGRHLSRRRH